MGRMIARCPLVGDMDQRGFLSSPFAAGVAEGRREKFGGGNAVDIGNKACCFDRAKLTPSGSLRAPGDSAQRCNCDFVASIDIAMGQVAKQLTPGR
jgi:hypothetical protein